ncbi:hypothetical protein GCM10010275_29950 [Streptomyces litmocidini]|uniref:hypothetical protein n=1 Tax=Streptomyces litmocidini TaxID=67318 RepID=UPI00167C8275|nr:hypothetical protein [Streptomyces litmocidini]GGU90960.1 hypothetical protein GCM10010275_29950 [Streptomyces litmocidini]
MARVRFIGPEPVTVPELGGRVVEPDQLVEVPDDRYEGYVCQTTMWEPVEEPTYRGEDEPETVAFTGTETVAVKKTTAAKPQKSEG